MFEPAAQSYFINKDPLNNTLFIGGTSLDGRRVQLKADLSSDTLTYSVNGVSLTFTINQVAAAYGNGDAQKAAAFAQQIRTTLATNMLGQMRGQRVGFQYNPPQGIPEPCDLSPCGPDSDFWGDGGQDDWYMSNYLDDDIYDLDPVEVTGNLEDRQNFDRWQQGQCEDAVLGTFATIFALIGSLGGCGAAFTPPATPFAPEICIGLFGGTTVLGIDALMSADDCEMEYPGPGNW